MTFPPEAKALNCPVIWRMPKTEASITQTNTTVSAFLPFFFFSYLLGGKETSLPELKLWKVSPSA